MKKILLMIILAFLMSGCQRFEELTEPEDFLNYPQTWRNVFEGFWTGMNNNYVFWDIDPTDWDKVYRDFRPKFIDLDRRHGSFFEHIPAARELFEELTKDLIDGHFAMLLTGDPLGYIYPAMGRMPLTEVIEGLRLPLIVRQNYLTENLAYHVLEEESEFHGFVAIVGKIPFSQNSSDGEILYFYFSSFEWTGIMGWDSPHRDSLLEIFDYFSQNLHSPNTRGVIVDVRGNRGGYISDLQLIWGQMFSSQAHKIGYSKQKTGDGRLDFGPLLPINIPRHPSNRRNLNVPLILLVNNWSVSSSELSALFVRSFANGTVVGSRTFGGLGALINNWVWNAGQFSTLGITLAYTPSVQNLDLNKESWEGRGVPPDVAVPFNEAEFLSGIDARLERALEIIRTGR